MKKIKVKKEIANKIIALLMKPLIVEVEKKDFDEKVMGKYLDLVTEAVKLIEVKK